jgi:hypothetical protein
MAVEISGKRSSLVYSFCSTDSIRRRIIMTSPFKHNSLKFAVVTVALVAAPMLHAAVTDSYVNNTVFEEYSGSHAANSLVQQPSQRANAYVRNTAFESLSGYASVKPTVGGMAGKPGEMGEQGSAGMTNDAAQPSRDSVKLYVRNTAFEDMSGAHAAVKPK